MLKIRAYTIFLCAPDRTRVGYSDVSPHHHYLMEVGIKIQCTLRQRISLGVGYEHQFFTDEKAPTGMNSIILSIGHLF